MYTIKWHTTKERFGRLVLMATLVLAVLAGGLTAVVASAIPEQFRTASRLTDLAVGGTVATTIFGGLAPYATQLTITSTGWQLAPGVLIAIAASAALPAIRRSPETAPLIRGSQ